MAEKVAQVYQKYFYSETLEDLLHDMGAWMEDFSGDCVEDVNVNYNDGDYWEGTIYYD